MLLKPNLLANQSVMQEKSKMQKSPHNKTLSTVSETYVHAEQNHLY